MSQETTTTAFVATVLQGQIVLSVIMEDPITHTAENGYQCGRRDCPCYQEAQERRNTARLHSSNGFSLLKRDPAQEWREAAQDRNMTTQCQDGSWW